MLPAHRQGLRPAGARLHTPPPWRRRRCPLTARRAMPTGWRSDPWARRCGAARTRARAAPCGRWLRHHGAVALRLHGGHGGVVRGQEDVVLPEHGQGLPPCGGWLKHHGAVALGLHGGLLCQLDGGVVRGQEDVVLRARAAPLRQVAGHDREVVASQFGNLGKQSASTPSALSEATGKLPCGLGQSVTSPSVLREGQAHDVRTMGPA